MLPIRLITKLPVSPPSAAKPSAATIATRGLARLIELTLPSVTGEPVLAAPTANDWVSEAVPPRLSLTVRVAVMVCAVDWLKLRLNTFPEPLTPSLNFQTYSS